MSRLPKTSGIVLVVLLVACTDAWCQTIRTMVFTDVVLPVFPQGRTVYQKVEPSLSLGLGVALEHRNRCLGVRWEREVHAYALLREAPPFQRGFSEHVDYQLNRITVYGAVSVARSYQLAWEALGGFGVSWVAERGTTGVRTYTNGPVQELELGSDATQRAYSIMLGLSCTRMFGNRFGLRAELLPIARLSHEWVDDPRGNGFSHPLVPDPDYLVKAGLCLIFQFSAAGEE